MATIGDRMRGRGFNDSGRHFRESGRRETRIPEDCIFNSFYGGNQKLRPELFYGCPKKLARLFGESDLKPTAFRRLYKAFQSFAIPLQMGSKQEDFETAKERFGIFYTEGIIRQNKRNVLPYIVVDFIDRHKDVILSSKQEMLGFFRYITSILCYFKGR